jgi:hypothetical protein
VRNGGWTDSVAVSLALLTPSAQAKRLLEPISFSPSRPFVEYGSTIDARTAHRRKRFHPATLDTQSAPSHHLALLSWLPHGVAGMRIPCPHHVLIAESHHKRSLWSRHPRDEPLARKTTPSPLQRPIIIRENEARSQAPNARGLSHRNPLSDGPLRASRERGSAGLADDVFPLALAAPRSLFSLPDRRWR